MSTVSPPLSGPVAATLDLAPTGYFQKPLATGLILGSFAFLTLPLALLAIHYPVAGLLWVYLWLFGMTHFVVTFTLYLQSSNLKHFAKDWKNQAIFFGIPIAIFVAFDLYGAFGIALLFPLFHLCFRGTIRLVDFYHFSRQCFGVLQLFKTESGARYPKWVKTAENAYFLGLAGLLQCTFLEGVRTAWSEGVVDPLAILGARFPLLKPADPDLGFWGMCLHGASWAILIFTLGLGLAIGIGYARAEQSGVGHGVLKPLLYLLAQTVSGMLAIAYLPLYIATLAMHYVEYHVVMLPRCLHTSLNPQSKLDRAFDRVRSKPWLFYACIIGAAGVITLLVRQSMSTMIPGAGDFSHPLTIGLILAVFDGVFVFHYFIEAFIWRFSDPYFRQSMAGLYFAPQPKPTAAG